jgi:uncharacterized protein (TIGR02217 family)
MSNFHEAEFPLSVALGASGGPERRTEIVTLTSGREVRNGRWADSRRRYDAASGVKTLADLHAVVAFFEERRGRLYGFRFRDRADDRSGVAGSVLTARDQTIGTGDGSTKVFQLIKTYGAAFAPYVRTIGKPVVGSVVLAVGGVQLGASAFSLDGTTGLVTLDTAPAAGEAITAGFLFDVPVRFDTDQLTVSLDHFGAGSISTIPLIEVHP